MIEVIATLQANALLFGLLLVRISAMFATAPVLSSRVVPIRVRAGLAVILALVLLPGRVPGNIPAVPVTDPNATATPWTSQGTQTMTAAPTSVESAPDPLVPVASFPSTRDPSTDRVPPSL